MIYCSIVENCRGLGVTSSRFMLFFKHCCYNISCYKQHIILLFAPNLSSNNKHLLPTITFPEHVSLIYFLTESKATLSLNCQKKLVGTRTTTKNKKLTHYKSLPLSPRVLSISYPSTLIVFLLFCPHNPPPQLCGIAELKTK